MAQEVKLAVDGMLLNWLKTVGDSVKQGEIIAEVEADKATVEVEAPTTGTLIQIQIEVGSEVKEGTIIALIGAQEESPETAPVASSPAPSASAAANGGTSTVTPADGRIKASPLAKRIAEERGVDLHQVAGSGPGGRIVKEDVENFQAAPVAPVTKPATPSPVSASAPSTSSTPTPAMTATPVGSKPTWGKLPNGDEVEVVELSRMRRAIAESTISSIQGTPHFYLTANMDVAALLELRVTMNEALSKEGIKITVNDMIVKATALTLKQFPNLNSHFYGDKLVRHKRINIGIAVALPNNGLMNVVSPDADKASLSAMAVHHKAMFERAREGKVKPEDLRGATFTVSNLGAYEVDHFSAIISPPEAGILAIGAAKKVPVVLADGTLGVGNRMNVTLSVDHRVSDGAEGAQFLQAFRHLIENPMRLTL